MHGNLLSVTIASHRVVLLSPNPLCSIYPSLSPTPDLFTISTALPFPECHRVGLIQYEAFSDWLLSLSDVHLRFLHVSYGLTAPFFSVLSNIPLSAWTTVIIYPSPAEGHLGCFQVLAVINKAAINISNFWVNIRFQLLWVSVNDSDC